MISFANLDAIAQALAAFRASGLIQHDSRDYGNYFDHSIDGELNMLRKADPTGLAMGMLLREMVEATIVIPKVQLSRLLREKGFLDQVRGILDLKDRIDQEIGEPAQVLMDRLEQSLRVISEEIGAPESREVAICLRDAIYSMDTGLSLRWLECSSGSMPAHASLCTTIHHFPNLSTFTDALREELPFGAHIARVGKESTAIAIKHPGRVAFLSSLKLSHHSGGMEQDRATGYHMAEKLDLNTAIERYPNWYATKPSPGGDHLVDANEHVINHVAKLPRDKLIWLAMIVEMASQRMLAVKPGTVPLVETTSRALPSAESRSNLPAVIQPNWTLGELDLEEMFASLRLSDWETKFLRPAIEGLSPEVFLRMEDQPWLLRLDTREVAFLRADMGYVEERSLKENSVEMVPVTKDTVGTREELEEFRRQRFGSNLSKYLLAWGNRRFAQEWKAVKPWVTERLSSNLLSALKAGCVTMKDPDFTPLHSWDRVHLYSQSLKHKTYNPRCIFDDRKPVTHVAYFYPQSDADLVEILGLKDKQSLPEFLQGWGRELSWMTADRHERRDGVAPYQCEDRWDFAGIDPDHGNRNQMVHATACINSDVVRVLTEAAPAKPGGKLKP